MKYRCSFVTNSSNSSFVLVNLSDKKKTGTDWLKEMNKEKVEEAIDGCGMEYDYDKLLQMAKKIKLGPKSTMEWICIQNNWDEEDKDIVDILNMMDCYYGKDSSENFTWY